MIYLDNAATTRRKPISVLKTLFAETILSANPGRGGHKAAIRAGLKIEETRRAIEEYFFEGNVVFTKNCTEALNLAVTAIPLYKKVITTYAEHNSVLRPLKRLERQGKITLKIIEPEVFAFEKELTRRDTGAVVLGALSNVTGKSVKIEKILRLVKKKTDAITIVDGAQSTGKTSFDYSDVDMLAASGHKGLYGVQGTGFLLVRRGIRLNPVIVGGTGTSGYEIDLPDDIPEGMEAGTLNSPGIIALGSAIKYIARNGERIAKHEKAMAEKFCELVKNEQKITIYSCENGIVLLNVKGIACTEVADILSCKYGICIRSGLHCAPLMHKALGTLPEGAVRVSFGRNNHLWHCYYSAYALKEISRSRNIH